MGGTVFMSFGVTLRVDELASGGVVVTAAGGAMETFAAPPPKEALDDGRVPAAASLMRASKTSNLPNKSVLIRWSISCNPLVEVASSRWVRSLASLSPSCSWSDNVDNSAAIRVRCRSKSAALGAAPTSCRRALICIASNSSRTVERRRSPSPGVPARGTPNVDDEPSTEVEEAAVSGRCTGPGMGMDVHKASPDARDGADANTGAGTARVSSCAAMTPMARW
mmetsp:Transcript_85250/g.221844  ORF Transcript_85250/g.221844 Transcript_85250/m.221844 type:complete len:223 (-) Transcript_85250:280-948(-)